MTIYRGDDTGAFGGEFLTIELDNPEEFVISKAEFRCGSVLKTFNNPVFPLKINLTKCETTALKNKNIGHLRIYDEDGNRITCDGSIEFETLEGVMSAS